MFHEYSKVFDSILFASAFKGANGINTTFMEIRRYLQNLRSYHDLERKFSKVFLSQRLPPYLRVCFQDLSGKIHEIVLTGWQRYFVDKNSDATIKLNLDINMVLHCVSL